MGLLGIFKPKIKKAELVEKKELEIRKTQQESIEKLNGSFDRMVDKLEDINTHLAKHISQQEQMLKRFDVIPELTGRQTALMEKTNKQIESQAEVTKQFSAIVKEIPEQAKLQRKEIEQVRETIEKSCSFEESMCAEFAKLNIQIEKQGKYVSLLWIMIISISVIGLVGLGFYIYNTLT